MDGYIVFQLVEALEFQTPVLASLLKEEKEKVADMGGLSRMITQLAHEAGEKLVLLIDEVDASTRFSPFLNFLGMLRTKYLARFRPQHATFHSIVLAGVHDIKTLKHKVRREEEAQYNSPWNIAVDFDVEMSFNPREIAPMLEEYSQAENAAMDVPAIAERLHYYTSGYPFLVSKLCKVIADYLDIHGVSQGFLVIFDDRKKKSWKAEAIRHEGKDVFAVWV